jgi:hypothetical protein
MLIVSPTFFTIGSIVSVEVQIVTTSLLVNLITILRIDSCTPSMCARMLEVASTRKQRSKLRAACIRSRMFSTCN